MIVGIPRGLFYYYHGILWENFFEKLNISYIISPNTNKEIKKIGNDYSSSEMCLSLKNYIGHVVYLKDKCDFILIPRIDNYGKYEQTCTNFLACYDIINNIVDVNILNYNIDLVHKESEYDAFIKLGLKLGKKKKDVIEAYNYACIKYNKIMKKQIYLNFNKLKSNKKKILLVSHPYNTYDETIGKPIINILEKMNCEVIYSDLFDKKDCLLNSNKLAPNLYWKYSKEIIGSIEICDNMVDGIIFLSTFPCGLDSLVNELLIRKIKNKCINIVIDDLDSYAGLETRLESFVDILV